MVRGMGSLSPQTDARMDMRDERATLRTRLFHRAKDENAVSHRAGPTIIPNADSCALFALPAQ